MNFTRGVIVTIALALAPQPTLQASDTTKPARPIIIIIILADDLGYGSTGCYGADAKLVRTPSILRWHGGSPRC